MKYRKSAIKELSEITGIEISKKSEVEERDNIIYVDKVPSFFKHENKIIPTLKVLKKFSVLPSVRIDEGAVRFLIKGADMMRPGIVEFEEFAKGQIISVKGPGAEIPLGVGEALFDSKEAINLNSGKIIKIIHFTGDHIWSASLP